MDEFDNEVQPADPIEAATLALGRARRARERAEHSRDACAIAAARRAEKEAALNVVLSGAFHRTWGS